MGRGFDENAISRVQKDLADDIEGLLGATRHQDIVRRGGDAIAGGVPGDHLPQRAIGLRGAILQGARPVLREDTLTGLLHLRQGKHVGGRQPPTNERTDEGSGGLRRSSRAARCIRWVR
jgi:hypothetical protein